MGLKKKISEKNSISHKYQGGKWFPERNPIYLKQDMVGLKNDMTDPLDIAFSDLKKSGSGLKEIWWYV